MAVNIGILALQGDVSEHILAFRTALQKGDISGEVISVRGKKDLAACDGFVLPGGESTTLSRLIGENGLFGAIQEYEGGIFATCAGMVLLGTETGDSRIKPLGIMNMTVERNAFGRQRESFEADIEIEGLQGTFHTIFIRAPVVIRAGPEINILARITEGAVGVQKERHMAFSFHPELTEDHRLHELFLRQLATR